MEQENEELFNFSIQMDFNTRGRNQQFDESQTTESSVTSHGTD